MHNEQSNDKAIFAFWVYLMTDLLTFAALFAVFAVLRDNTFGGPSGRELFDLPFVLSETFILLTSSFTCGLAMIAVHQNKIPKVFLWFGATLILGAAFLGLEFYEFSHLILEGHDWTQSAFLSAFFALVGTHGLHIAIGLLWLLVALIMIYKKGITPFVTSKLVRFSLFWHFLDLVWIFIFTVVYLMAYV